MNTPTEPMDCPQSGMAFRYIGNLHKDTFAHEIHYFVGKNPLGSDWIMVATNGSGQRIHWLGFPQDYERWPEKDKVITRQPASGDALQGWRTDDVLAFVRHVQILCQPTTKTAESVIQKIWEFCQETINTAPKSAPKPEAITVERLEAMKENAELAGPQRQGWEAAIDEIINLIKKETKNGQRN